MTADKYYKFNNTLKIVISRSFETRNEESKRRKKEFNVYGM